MRGLNNARLISVIVPQLELYRFQISRNARIKSSQIHSSRAVAGRRLVYGGHAGVYHVRVLTPMRVRQSVVFIQAGLFKFFYPRAKPQTFTQAAARSEPLLLRRRLGEPATQREIGSAIPDFAGDCVSGAVYRKYPFDRSNSGRSRRLRHGDEGRRAPSADVLRCVE